jgi:uncharacterized protein YndB with AHSA1/START domain
VSTMKTITATIYIAAKPDAVWSALTQPTGVAALYFGSKLVTTFEPGATYQYVGDDGTVHVLGEVLEHVPSQRFVITHRAGPKWQPGPKTFQSRLSYAMEDVGFATKLSLVHDQIEDEDPGYAHNVDGWMVFLSSVKSYVETGKALKLG